MATKKYLELQEYPDADLKAELTETEAQYQKLKFDHAIRGLDNPTSLREIRRDIARLKTEIRRRELAQATADERNARARIRQRRRVKK